jgi:hypothetical protein
LDFLVLCYRKNRERRTLKHHEGIESENTPKRNCLAAAGRRSVRERQTEKAHDHRGSGSQKKWRSGSFDSQAPDGHADSDPSQSSENTDQRKIAGGIFQVLQREGIGQGDGGEIAKTIGEHQNVHGGKTGGQNPLGGEKTVSNQAHKKWGDDASKRGGSENCTCLCR